MTKGRGTRIASLITVFAILLSLSLVTNHRLFGCDMAAPASEQTDSLAATSTLPDGSVVINTTSIAKEVEGYAGPTPFEITISPEGTVTAVNPLPNDETPSFFEEVVSALPKMWIGKNAREAAGLPVDAVSGATYSSEAVIANVRNGLTYYLDNHAQQSSEPKETPWTSPGWWGAVAVSLAAAIIPLLTHNKRYRFIQLLANVGVLGFWTGTFLSYTIFNSLISGQLRLTMLPAWILMATAFIIPLFRTGNHYCIWSCPFGSAQQLAGMAIRHKPHLNTAVVKALSWLRRALWAVLMLSLWSGMWTEWLDYEIFISFIIPSAPTVILILAGAFVLLSSVVDRPFCRFVCPVGTIINLSENNN